MSVCAAASVAIVSSITMSTFLNIFISTAKIRKESQITQIILKYLLVSATFCILQQNSAMATPIPSVFFNSTLA
jgi:hypothetical protein